MERKGGGVISGGPVGEGFTRGWALRIGSFGRARFWLRRAGADAAVKLCTGAITPMRLKIGQLGLLHSGEFPQCKNCQRARGEA